MAADIDHKVCPICHQPNNCQHIPGAKSQPDCWCSKVTVPPGLLDHVPRSVRGKVCICKNCVEAYHPFPSRIVCLSPDIVNMLLSINSAEKIVGIPSQADRAGIPNPRIIGGFGNPDFQTILSLKPDLVIGYSELCEDITARLIRSNINVLVLHHSSLEEIYQSLTLLGQITDRIPEAAHVIRSMQAEFRKIASDNSSLARRPVIYFEEWNRPYVCGVKWVSEMIATAGGIDGLAHRCQPLKYAERVVTTDEVVAANPEIIVASWCGKPVNIEEILNRPGWENIPAVKNRQVYEIPGKYILQPGPVLLEGTRIIHEIIKKYPVGQ